MSPADDRPLVLITGASGLFGTKVARLLVDDYRVVGLDLVSPPEDYPDTAELVECDLTSREKTDAAIERVVSRHGPEIASVIHLAAYYDFSGEPSPLYEELTVRGTERLLQALKERTRTRQIVFSSSLLVMRPTEDDVPLDETSPVQAEWDYPESKLQAEDVLRRGHEDIPVVVLRIAGAYDEWGHSPPITQQIWRIREKKLESFLFPGNREHGQSFVHVDDVASCVKQVVRHREELEPWEIFLIGEPETLSYGELQERIGERLHGREWPTLRIPAPVAKAGAWLKEKTASDDREPFIKPWMIDLADAHYPVSIERARQRLDWEPRHRLGETLTKMVENLVSDPRRFARENDLPGAGEAKD